MHNTWPIKIKLGLCIPLTCAICQTLTPYQREIRVRLSPGRTVCQATHPLLAVTVADALSIGAACAATGVNTVASTIASANRIDPARTPDLINLRLMF